MLLKPEADTQSQVVVLGEVDTALSRMPWRERSALLKPRAQIADPHFRGAGLSITLPGGHLALHADFNRDRTRHLSRKLTVLYYLGEDWDDAWGGALELWNEERTRCEASYAPRLDRLVVMDHGDTFWHGHPAPLACPEDRYRASISAYYYVAAAPDETDAHGAIWADDAILGRST